MISALTGKTYVEKLNELNLLSLEENRERADIIQTFKIIHGFCDVNPPTWFRKINHNRVTRLTNDSVKLGNTKLQNQYQVQLHHLGSSKKMELHSTQSKTVNYSK